jgi:integrase
MGVRVREKPQGSGTYWVFIDHHGKRKAKKIGKDKRTAQEVARKIEARLVLGDLSLLDQDEEKTPTFGEYAQTWIKVTVPATCKPATLYDYQIILKIHVLPEFGKIPITEINRHMVKKFLMTKVKAGFAQSTITHMKNVIAGTLNLAVDDEVIPVNPAHRLGKIFRAKSPRPEIDPLTREEVALLLENFKKHYPTDYPLALLLARTGLRIGEAIALKWDDIDFNSRFLTIRRNFSRGKIETPKNGKSRRVDMSLQLTQSLLDLRHQRRVETLKNGWREVPEWVFLTAEGTPMDSCNWRNRVFNKALKKGGLRKIRIHDLRHTYASLLIQGGESLAYIRDQLGHHSIKVTVDIYGHLAPEGNKEAVDRLDDPHPDETIRNPGATKKAEGADHLGQPLDFTGGSDETRTRDLRRDRPAF